MKKALKVAGLALVGGLAIAGSVSLAFGHAIPQLVGAEVSTPYAMTLSSSNGNITAASYGELATSTTARTTSGNAFSMSYYHAKAASGYYCVLDAENPRTNASGKDGYVYSTNGVNGLETLNITFSFTGDIAGQLLVYFSDSTTFSGDPVIAESGLDITAGGSYFKIQALSQPVQITSIAIGYSCDEASHVYGKASAAHTSKPETSLIASMPTNALPSDFAYGIDASEIAQIEQLGSVYYNENGVAEDPLRILADDGANYARIRIWNDPYDSNGDPYMGGTNDLATDIHLAKRAKAAGMKVLLDFHYSDFWTDPENYNCPKAWTGGATADLVTSFTKSTLQSFKHEGITIDSVQIGNEINSGMAGTTMGSSTFYALLNAGIGAAESVFPGIEKILHLTNVHRDTYMTFVNNLCNKVSGFDVIGFSYYPFWHGGKGTGSNYLLAAMNYVAAKGYKTMVLENSTGFTLNWTQNTKSIFGENFVKSGGFPATPQGQMDELCDILDVASKVNDGKCKGVFYYGACVVEVAGGKWATQNGQRYKYANKDLVVDEWDQKETWCNQSLFDFDGNVLGAAQAYNLVKNGTAGKTYAQDTENLKYQTVTYEDGKDPVWNEAIAMTYDSKKDVWEADIALTTDLSLYLHTSYGGVWPASGVGHWYFNQVASTVFADSDPSVIAAGTYRITVKDSTTDGDATTSFAYYHKLWNGSGIVGSIQVDYLYA